MPQRGRVEVASSCCKIVWCSLSIGDLETIEDCELEFSIKKECVVHALQSVLPRNLVKRKISGALII